MLKTESLNFLAEQLVKEGYEKLAAPPAFIKFTGVQEADDLLNDLAGHPHAFVFACIMDRQIKAEKAWLIPYELKQRLGFFDFANLATLAELSPGKVEAAMLQPTPLHRFPNEMSKNLLAAIHCIKNRIGGNAASIWAGRPSSATIVRGFLEFRGVGQKIATMAANILVRDFHVEVSDCYSIDISVDVQVARVFARMGFVPLNTSIDYLIFRARELQPDYPGIFDPVLWDLGRTVCRPTQPECGKCRYSHLCMHANGGDVS
jgi:endonuclease III